MSSIRLALISFMLLQQVATTRAAPMTFELQGNGGDCHSCFWINADGEITSDTADHLQSYLSSIDPSKWHGLFVRLNSPGGNLLGGIKLGEFIRKSRLSTAVGRSFLQGKYYSQAKGECDSACAFAFLGGVERTFDEQTGSRIGIHQFYNEAAIQHPMLKAFNAVDLSDQEMLNALIIDYTIRMGVNPRFVVIAAETLPINIHYLSQKEADTLNVTSNSRTQTYDAAHIVLACKNPRRNYLVTFDFSSRSITAAADDDISQYKVLSIENSQNDLLVSGLTVNDGPTFLAHFRKNKRIEYFVENKLFQTDDCQQVQ